MSWLSKIRSLFSKEEEIQEEDVTPQDLSTMKVSELRAVAKNRGLKGYSGLRKAQLLERLQNG